MNIADLDEPIDVMAISAYYRDYQPIPRTMIHALKQAGINVDELSRNPEIDFRDLCGVWLSRELYHPLLPIKRIGCIEMLPHPRSQVQCQEQEQRIISSIQAYFCMLNILSLSGTKIESIGLPILGGGSQKIDMELIKTPLINECIQFLKTNESVKTIHIISYNQNQAFRFAKALEESYSFKRETKVDLQSKELRKNHLIFISHSSQDREIAMRLSDKLEAQRVKTWYAPRDISHGNYASSIVDAIMKSTHFVVIISKHSLSSEHVLNELDLAFQELARGIQLLPLRIDEENMGDAFRYYLSRQQWINGYTPPLEQRLDEFVELILNESIKEKGKHCRDDF